MLRIEPPKGVSTLRASIPIAQGLAPLREPRRYRAATTLRLRRSSASLRAAPDRAVSLPPIGLNRIPQAVTTPRSSGPCRPGGSGFARWRVNPQAGSPPSLGALLPTRNGFAVPLRSHSRPCSLTAPSARPSRTHISGPPPCLRLRFAPPALRSARVAFGNSPFGSAHGAQIAGRELSASEKIPPQDASRLGAPIFSAVSESSASLRPKGTNLAERDSRHARFGAGVRGTLRSTHVFFFYLLNALPPPWVSNRQFTLRPPGGGQRMCVSPFLKGGVE